jgi:hypothetical protein
MEYVINTKKKKRDDAENGDGDGPYNTKNISGSGSLEDLAKRLRNAADENGHIAGAFMMGPDGEAIPLDISDGPESIIKSLRAELSKRLGPGEELDEAMRQVSKEIRSGKMGGRVNLKGGGRSNTSSDPDESARVSREDTEKLGPVKWGQYNPGRRVVIESMGIPGDRASEVLEELASLVMLRGDVGATVQLIEGIPGWDFREKAYAIMNMEKLRADLERSPALATGRLLKSVREDRAKKKADPSFRSEVLEALEKNPEALEKVDRLLEDGFGEVYDLAREDALKRSGLGTDKESIVERVRRRKEEREREMGKKVDGDAPGDDLAGN